MLFVQIVFIVFFLLALTMTWRRYHQRVIRFAEAFAWSAIWVGGSIAVSLPDITTRIAHVFGIGRGADFILYGSVAMLFILTFTLFVQHEKLERKLTDVVRRDALRDVERERT